MKHRWIAAPLLVGALALGACAPQQGADGSAEPTGEPTEVMTSPTPEPTQAPSPGVEASESAAPTPDSYEY